MLAFPHTTRFGRISDFWITSSETGPILALIEKQKPLSRKRMNPLTRRKPHSPHKHPADKAPSSSPSPSALISVAL